MFEDFSKRFKRALARYGMYFSSWLFERLPFSFVRAIGNFYIFLGYTFVVRQKKLAAESLKIAFGNEKSPREINRIIKKCFSNLGQGMVEMVYYISHPCEVPKRVTIEGKEYLDQALQKGNGVVAVTAHFGNFPLMMLYFGQMGYPTSSIIRPARDQGLEEYLLRKRTESKLKTIYALPRRDCVAQCLKVLRNNELLFVPLDQNAGGGGGIFVDFFGQKAATATGPVVFALRTNAIILPMFIIRVDDMHHKIIIEPPVELERHADEEQMIAINISKITKLIEQYVRRYPYEWGWMHRRWKTQALPSASSMVPQEQS